MTLDELEKLCEAATPGPWEAEQRHAHGTGVEDEMSGLGWDVDGPPEPLLRGMFSKAADAKLIVAARTALPELIRQKKRLRELLPEWLMDQFYDETDLTEAAFIESKDLIHGDL